MSHENQGDYTEVDGMEPLDAEETEGHYTDENAVGVEDVPLGEEGQGNFTEVQEAAGDFEGETTGEPGGYTDADQA